MVKVLIYAEKEPHIVSGKYVFTEEEWEQAKQFLDKLKKKELQRE